MHRRQTRSATQSSNESITILDKEPSKKMSKPKLRQKIDRFWQRKRTSFGIGLITGVVLLTCWLVLFQPTASPAMQQLREHLPHAFRGYEMMEKMMADDFSFSLLERIKLENILAKAPSPIEAGKVMKEKNATAHYPVFIIPGIVSSNLESWARGGCAEQFFRRKIWGDLNTMGNIILDKDCYLKNLLLDAETGLDPQGAKVRVAQGIDAADYFVNGYFVWSRMIENLAYIGYDSNNMHVASYDWRLSFPNLEIRDGYFSKLKANVELSYKLSKGRKVVFITHSMGGMVIHYFLKWVESKKFGNSPGWVDKYVHAINSIATPFLGVPKTLASILSGEMRDTAQLGWLMQSLLERFFTKKDRAAIFRSWTGVSSMLPKGGNSIWGSLEKSVEDTPEMQNASISFGTVISFEQTEELKETFSLYGMGKLRNFTMEDSLKMVMKHAGEQFKNHIKDWYSVGTSMKDLESAKFDNEIYWSNPLQSALPRAPNMTIYNFHGVGKTVERSYRYTVTEDPSSVAEALNDFIPVDNIVDQDKLKKARSDGKVNKADNSTSDDGLPLRDFRIDTSHFNPDVDIEFGTASTSGDGSVPLLSLGYMSAVGWKYPSKKMKHAYGHIYNPGKVKVLTREYEHDPLPIIQDIRGGPKTSEHVDILGNYELTLDILKVVSAREDEIEERVVSNIHEMADKIELSEYDF